MKRSFALLLVVPVALYAWACSSSSSNNNNTGTDGGPKPGTDGGPSSGDDGGPSADDGGNPNQNDGSVPTTTNPIGGISAPTLVVNQAGFVNGLRLFDSLLYASDPTASAGAGVQYTIDPTNVSNSNPFRMPSNGAIGIAIDSKKTLLMTTETDLPGDGGFAGDVIHLYADGGTSLIANSWDAGAGPLVAFDSPNDLTMRKSDGTIYVTDPGFQNGATTNHVFKIAPSTNAVTAVDSCTDVCNPNGIAISPDEKTLYVGYTYQAGGTTPFIQKFTVATDGTLSNPTKFATVGTDLDGLGIDDNGNVYATYNAGVAVYAPDGTKWGEIAIPGNTSGSAEPGVLAFGGTARTTLYIGTGPGLAIYSVTVKVPGRVE